ncbi:MAG: SDR family NAD(P)-dependent oxidoreductase, partial [Bacteroidota bacterium]
MKILVTGGTGYIGSHTVVELQKKGIEVFVVDNLSNSFENVIDQIELITGIRPGFENFDLTDRDKTSDYFSRHKDLDGVIHFAANKAVGESVSFPVKYYRNNLVSLMNILESMTVNGIRNIVFSSSCTVYGQPEVLPVKETSPVQVAMSPYGNTKQIGEEIIRDHAAVNDIKAILLRYFNPIGAHDATILMKPTVEGAQTGLAIDGSASMKNSFGAAGAVSSLFSAASPNIVEPVAQTIGAFLANFDSDGQTTVIYWACGIGGTELEDLGD